MRSRRRILRSSMLNETPVKVMNKLTKRKFGSYQSSSIPAMELLKLL